MIQLNAVYFNPEMFVDIISLEEAGQAGLVIDLVDEYSSTFGSFIAKIHESLLTEDFQALNHVAHSLKSSSSVLGLEMISKICLQIENESSKGFCSPELFDLLKEARDPSLKAIIDWVVERSQAKKIA